MTEAGKMLILIGDGMGDWPVAELNGDTPIEAATKPNLDRLSREGENGLMDPIAVGVRAGSDTAHLAILGFDPINIIPAVGHLKHRGLVWIPDRGTFVSA